MTLTFDDSLVVFPSNAILVIATRLQDLYPDLRVVKRPLKHTDASQSVGVYPGLWVPDETSFEFESREPTVQRYIVNIQSFCKEMTEEKGIAIHSVMSKVIRAMLYNDNPLALALNTLQVTMFGSVEKIQRRGITRQVYLSNEISGVFVYLSTLETYIETETK